MDIMQMGNRDLQPTIFEPVDRRGRFRAELADGTVLTMSRQPFLDAARTLISAGYSPDIVLVSWRKGSSGAPRGGGKADCRRNEDLLRSLEALFLVGGRIADASF